MKGRKRKKNTSKVQRKSAGRTKQANGGKPAKGVKPAKVFLYALGVAAIGGGAYLAYDRLKSRNVFRGAQEPDTIIINNNLPASSAASASASVKASSAGNDQFPLKRGSRGLRVGQLQRALESIIGVAAMKANGGVDGIFGAGTANALKMAGYGEVIDQAMFNTILGRVSGSSSPVQPVFNASDLALQLYRAAQNKMPETVLSLLQQIQSVSDYSAVNEYYKQQGFISKTIVTDLLDFAFTGHEAAKQQIRNEFLRIGLKLKDDGRWSLQGIRLYKDLITLRATFVTDPKGIRIAVNRNTILGDEVQATNGMTWFRSVDNSILTVPTQDVKYT